MAFRLRPVLVAAVLAAVAAPVVAQAPAAGARVAILRSVAWSPLDAARDGAGEFEVLLCVAQLQRTHRLAGLVSVGDRHGVRRGGGEKALTHAALSGLPVVRLAPGGTVAATPWDIFLDGGQLGAETAQRILGECLERLGSPPPAADPERPTARELAAIRAHLKPFQAELVAAGRVFALR